MDYFSEYLKDQTKDQDDLTYYDLGQHFDEFDQMCSPSPSCTVSKRNTENLLPYINFCDFSSHPNILDDEIENDCSLN